MGFRTPLDLAESYQVDGPLLCLSSNRTKSSKTETDGRTRTDKEQEVFNLAASKRNSHVHNMKKMLERLLYALTSPDLLSAQKWCCQKEITGEFSGAKAGRKHSDEKLESSIIIPHTGFYFVPLQPMATLVQHKI